jgi:Ca2+-binding EF-hand superfamily protein
MTHTLPAKPTTRDIPMKTTHTLVTGMLLAAAGTLLAQSEPPRQAFGTGELPAFLKPYDLDEDGKLSVEERQAFEQAMREARPPRPGAKHPWDTDGDGRLSQEEITAAREAIAAKVEETRSKRFDELDKDEDGQLTSEELAGIPRITPEMIQRMIQHLDKDADGQISKDEFLNVLRPVPPPIPPFPLPNPLPNLSPTQHLPAQRPVAEFDKDANGRLNREEIAELLRVIDRDGNRFISPEEWRTYFLGKGDTDRPVLPPPPAPPTEG